MTKRATTKQQLVLQVEELRSRLEEAEETLRAIRTGEVDALVVSGPEGEAVYTLKGAEHSYRVILETMNEGALTLSDDGTVLYCNARFAELVKMPIEQVIGGLLRRLVAPADQSKLEALMALSSGKAEMTLTASDGTQVPSQLSTRFLQMDGLQATCVVATDLRQVVAVTDALRTAHLDLGERVKELTVLHQMSGLLQDERKTTRESLQEIVARLPAAWQYPEITAARIVFAGQEFATPNFAASQWTQSAEFTVEGQRGIVEVCYLEERPPEAEGPFLAEERNVINSLAQMLQSHLDRRQAAEALRRAHDELEIRVKERTSQLAKTNEELEMAEEELRSQNEELLAARQTLEDERQRYQDLFEFAPDGYLVTDPQGIIQEANRAAVALLGIPQGSLLGKPLVVFVDEAHTPLKLFYAQLKPLLQGEVDSIHNWELVLEPEDRAPFPAAITVGPVGNTRGEVTGLRWLVRDVTDRKRAENEIASLARFPSENPNPVLRLSQDGAVLYANEASKSLLQEWECRVGDPAPSYWRGLVAQAVASRANKTVDVESGDRVYSFFVTPIAAAGYVNLYGRDITERKQAEEALRRSEALYRAIARNLPESSVYVVDLDGRFLVAEGVLMSRLGQAREQLEGRTIREAHDEQTLQLVEPGWLRALSGETTSSETAYRGRMLYSQYVPLRDESGRVLGAMALAQDITERKKREEELRRLNRTLRAHSHSDQALMRATIEADYMQDVCRIIVEDCGHAMVWIGLAEDDEGKTVRPVAYAGFEEGYLDTLHITWADTERGRGPTGTAIRTGKPSFCRNMLTDPKFSHWRAEALKRGYASSLVLPLLDEGRAFGALNIYFREPDPFSEDEVTLLSGLADDLAYGIRTIRLRTAHARAEQALRQSEERYRSLFEGMTEGFVLHEIICDEKGEPCDYRFLEINPSFERLTGLTREGVVGKTHNEVLPDDDPYWVEIYGAVALTGQPIHFENYSSALNRHYDVFAYCPAPRQFAALFMDITERKQAEEQLRETRDYLENLLNYANAPIIVWDPQFRITRFNHAFERLTGLDAAEVLGQQLDILFPVDRRDDALGHIRRALAGERWEVVEIPIAHVGGTVRTVLWNSATLYAPDGTTAVATIAQGQDITERKQAEQEREALLAQLEAEKLRWQATVESMLDPVTVCDAEGHATYMNAAYSRMVERNIQSDLELGEHSNYYQLYRPDGTIFAPDELPLQHAALYNEPAQNVEIVQRDPAGGEHIAIWNAAPLRDPQGRVTGAVAVGRDVTEQRKAEIEREWLLSENRRQRQFLERLMEVAPVGIAVVRGPDHIYEFVNPYYRAIPGAPDVSMVGRSLAEVFPQVAAGGALEMVETVYRTGQTVSVREYEATVGPGRGKTFWDVDSVPLYDTAGQVDSVLILAHEVTEQVLARRQIEELAARDEAILDSMTEGLMIADLQGNVLSLNPAARRIHGHEISEDVDKPFLEFVPAFELCDSDGQPMASNEWPLPRILRGETLQNLETLVRRTDTGQVRIVSYGGTLVRDKTGQPILSIVTSRDVTAQKEAEAERMRLLQEVQRRAAELDAVITSIADGVMIHDQAAGIVRMNPAAERILGYSPAERELSLAERTTRVIRVTSSEGQPINPEDMPVPRALRGQTVRNSVMSVQRWHTGNQVWVSMSAAPIRTPEGATLGAVSTLTDITELRQAQQSLEQANERLQAQMEELEVQKEEMEMLTQELLTARDELELHVQERTEKLASTNQELQIASEQLREQNEELFVARQAVEAERKRYQDMFEFAPDGYLVTSPDGIIHEANRAAAALLHVSQGSLVGKPLAVYVAEQDRLAFYTSLARPRGGADSTAPGESEKPVPNAVIESRPGANETCPEQSRRILRFAQNDMNSMNVELYMQPRQRAAFHAELTFAPVHGAQGDLVGLRWLLRDISERKRAEEALRLASAYNRRLIEASLDPLVTIGPDGKITDVNSATEAITGRSREELIGTEFLEYFTEPQKARAGYQQVFRDGLVRDYALEIRRRDGRVTPVLYNASVYRDDAGQVVGVFAAARDITERVQAYQLLEQRVQERTRELSTLLAISNQVASTLELSPLLSLILDQLKVMIDYTGLSILLLEGDELIVREYRGPYPRDKALQARFSLQASVGGQAVISRREPVIIADLQDDSPLARAYRATTLGESMTFTGDARSWMGVPLIVKDQVIGMLRLSYTEPNCFTPHHAQLVLAIANQAAVAIENARLYERAQQAAALEERQRLARELHDSVSQALYGIALGAHTALAMLDSDRTKLVEALNYVISLVGAAMTEMRALIFELRPESLRVEGLATALGKHAAALSARFGIEVDTELCEEPEVPLASKEALYRIAQEALQNAVKHARPTRLSLQLICEADSLVLQVSDDGIGFDPTASFPGHLGLRSMRERAARVGGTLEIESAPGRGTRLRACVPVPAAGSS